MRKISPVLTSANPPLIFAEEVWPWANIRAHLPPLYVGLRRSVASQAVHQCAPGIRTGEPWAAAAEHVHLTTCAIGPAPRKIINEMFYILCFLYQAFEIWYVFYAHNLATFQALNNKVWPVAAVLDREGFSTPVL